MLVAAGKHYICIEAILSIRYVEVISCSMLFQIYEFRMKNNEEGFRMSAEEFDNFKINCGGLRNNVFQV